MKKPLGHKSYGSIGHLHNSRLGPGDHKVDIGQHRLCVEKCPKNWRIIVQEKLDGSCVSAAKINGEIIALGRAGYKAYTSPYSHIREFQNWVNIHRGKLNYLLREGERVVGEWMLLQVSIPYVIKDYTNLFVPFDLINGHLNRATSNEVVERCREIKISGPNVIHMGPSINPQHIAGRHLLHPDVTAQEIPEGFVYRAESDGQVKFLAKWVKEDHEPGKWLPGDSKQKEKYNDILLTQ